MTMVGGVVEEQGSGRGQAGHCTGNHPTRGYSLKLRTLSHPLWIIHGQMTVDCAPVCITAQPQ